MEKDKRLFENDKSEFENDKSEIENDKSEMHHSDLYTKLINSRRWRELRARKLEANPLCERHLKEGKVVAASVVHHIVEVESGHSEQECMALAYSWANLQSLCRECHAEIHKASRYHSKDAHQQREHDRLEQWKSQLKQNSIENERK